MFFEFAIFFLFLLSSLSFYVHIIAEKTLFALLRVTNFDLIIFPSGTYNWWDKHGVLINKR